MLEARGGTCRLATCPLPFLECPGSSTSAVPDWPCSSPEATFLAVALCREDQSPVCTPGPPLPSKTVCLVTCSRRRLVAGKLDELTLRKEWCRRRLPPPALPGPHRLLVGIRGLAAACPAVYRHLRKESQRGRSLTGSHANCCHAREVGWGLRVEIHSTVAQAVHRTCEPRGGACGEAGSGQGGHWGPNHWEPGSPAASLPEAGLHSPPWPLPPPGHQVSQLLVSVPPSHRDVCG